LRSRPPSASQTGRDFNHQESPKKFMQPFI
jgi:hypothetical protein